jgi:hypothetical protein
MTQQTQTQKKKDLPLWLGLGLILLGLLAAGWYVWSQTNGFWTGAGGVFTIEGPPPADGKPTIRMRRQPTTQPPSGAIVQRGGSSYMARSGPYGALIRKVDGAARVNISVSLPDALPDDHKWITIVQPKLGDAASVKAMGLAPKEVDKLKALPISTRFGLSPAKDDLAKLTQIADRYIAADPAARPPIDREFALALSDIGQRLAKDVPAQVKRDYAAAEQMLTTERWQKLKAYAVAPPPPTPASQPSK